MPAPTSPDRTRCCVALALAAAAGLASPVAADVYSWAAGNGWYFTPGNWLPNGVPGSNDTVKIGNIAGIENHTVLMGAGVVGAGYDRLELSSGMTLDLNGSEFVSFGEAWITGQNTRLIARPRAGLNISDFQGVLRLGAGATLDLRDNVSVRIFDDSSSSGTITGRGELLVASTEPFRNSGEIRPSNNGGLVVIQGTSPSTYPIDLDGSIGAGQMRLDVPFAQLRVIAGELSDPFSGTLTMVPGSLLTMDVGAGWSADSPANFNITGTNNPAAASQINGAAITFGGTLDVGGDQGHLRVLSGATLTPTAQVNIGPTDWLELDGATTVEGGQYTLGQNAKLDFDGPVVFEGGEFTTATEELADGFVAINGPTEWDGTVDFNGAVRQNGDATVTGPTVITVKRFDFGGDSQTHWDINSSLVINADAVGAEGLDFFDGVLDIGGSVTNKLTLNRTGAGSNQGWVMDGQMNLSGSTLLYSTRLAGSFMVLAGELNIANAKIEVTSGLVVMPWGAVNFAAPTSDLRLRGETLIREGATFQGAGTLRNGIGGEMRLNNGASLAQVGLANHGLLWISATAPDLGGTISVDRFTNETQGTWRVRIGGTVPGVGHDRLVVSGGAATLAGAIEVDLIDLGLGGHTPVVGEEFTVLTAAGGITGTFDNSPTSITPSGTYHWTVIYQPNSVVLRLRQFTPPAPCYPNCDGSTTPPILNVSDFVCFQSKFAGGSPYANCDGSTTPPILNVSDFICFQQKYAAGCS